jgi:hypothetical protein
VEKVEASFEVPRPRPLLSDDSSSANETSIDLEAVVQNTPVVSKDKKPRLFDHVRKSLPPIAHILSEKRLRPTRKFKRQVSAGRILGP